MNKKNKNIKIKNGTEVVVLDKKIECTMQSIVSKLKIIFSKSLTEKQYDILMESLMFCFFRHSDDVAEFEDMILRIDEFMDIFICNLSGGRIDEQ